MNDALLLWKLISLHIRSMWETICEAQASWSGWEFGSKIPVYPILGFGSQNTSPPPRKLKFRQIMAFQDFSLLTCGEYLPLPPPPENWNLGRSWHFKTFHFWLVENTPPTHWNLGILWLSEFWLAQNTTPPANWAPRRYVETNICRYRLVASLLKVFDSC